MTLPPRSLSTHGYALHCDEYELTMAQSFLRRGQTERVCFELVVRTLPPQRGYLVVAGLEQALAYLIGLRFDDADIAYLESLESYGRLFIDHLRGLRFSGDVDAIAEGTVVGAGVPLLRVTAPRVEATLVESALLALVNHQTLIASKAARVVDAAAGRQVWDFSLRRDHGPEAAVAVARASYIAGAEGTATVVAGRLLGIPITGTMAHHFVLAHGPAGELEAFSQFLRDYPDRAVLLVDTYDTVRGVQRAIEAARATDVRLSGIRLDSGDLDTLAVLSRAQLDAEGFEDTRIVASNDLDEYRIRDLVAAGAPIDSFGVGTRMGTSYDAPALSGIYKLVAQEVAGVMQPVMKLSEEKRNDPGIHQLFRDEVGDTLGLEGETLPGRRLLHAVIRRGELCAELPELAEIRRHCLAERERLSSEARRIDDPQPLPLRRSAALEALLSTLGSDVVHVTDRGVVA
jgi:nicotinate phosphoribosyltransferase